LLRRRAARQHDRACPRRSRSTGRSSAQGGPSALKLYCATSNPGKLREFGLAAGPDWEFVPLTGIPPCEETGATFEANAIEKAVYYSRHASGLLFAEDSGLEVDAL